MLSFALFLGCQGPLAPLGTSGPINTPPTDTGPPGDTDVADTDVADTSDTPVDTDLPADTDVPNDTGTPPAPSFARGQAWARSNPMFISGLVPHLEGPSALDVSRYYDGFGATATHVWEDALPTIIDDWAASNQPGFRWVSWVNREGQSHENWQVVGGVSPGRPDRIGYQIGDEPRSWDQVTETDAGVLAVRAADPDALIIVNLGTPDDFVGDFEDFVVHFAEHPDVDIVSYDLYAGGYGEYERLEIVRREALANDKLYWRYLNSFVYLGEEDAPVFTDLRWDAFVGLVYGYTGHSWFVYEVPASSDLETTLFDNNGSWQHTPNASFDWVSTLNRQMAELGRAITQLTSTEVCFIPGTPLYAPNGTHSWSPGAGGDPYITSIHPYDLGSFEVQDALVGFFVDDTGDPYTMLQNPHRESAGWPLFLSPWGDFRIDFDFSSAPTNLDRTRLQMLDKDTGTVTDLNLFSTGTDTARLEIRLPAGDAVLFKYADGTPFALQARP